MKIYYYAAAGIVAIVLIVAAIGIQQTTSRQESTIRVGFFPNIGHAAPIVGLEKEIISKKLGDEFLIQERLFDSGPQLIESMFANSIDIGYVGPGPTINGYLKSHGTELKIIAGAASGGASFVVHPNSKIESGDDFAGKKIAAPQIGNSQDVSLRHYLAQHGLKPAEKGGSVIIFNVANPDIYTLFAKGDIDGAWIAEPWATVLERELGGERLFHEEDLWPNKQFASVLLIVKTSYLEQNPAIIHKWLEAHHETVDWINKNPENTTLIFNNYLKKTLGKGLPEHIVEESFSNLQITADPIKDSIFIFVQRADSLGYLGREGYNLDGIFYDNEKAETEKLGVVLVNG